MFTLTMIFAGGIVALMLVAFYIIFYHINATNAKINAKINALEDRTTFSIPNGSSSGHGMFYTSYYKDVSIKEVVKKLLDYNKLEINLNPSVPAKQDTIKLEKVKPQRKDKKGEK